MTTNWYEKIYFALPLPFQNLAVSIKGLQIQKTRRRGCYTTYKSEVGARQKWSKEEHEKFQLNQLKLLLAHARENVTFYRKLFAKSDFHENRINTLSDLALIPIAPRSAIQENPQDFLASSQNTAKQLTLHTTGTTGSPLKVVCSKEAREKNYAFFDSYLESIGLNPDAKHVVIGGRILMLPDDDNPPFWRYSAFQKSLLMSSYHLKRSNIKFFVDKIERFNPEYIESYPSSIYTIAKFIIDEGLNVRCKAIVTSAETLFPEQKKLIEKAFNCRVYDQYGCAEMCVFVAQCGNGNYHARTDYGVLEILGDNGEPVPHGEYGNVVCTGFINYEMPLIRYPIGDRAAFGDACTCGLPFPTIQSIEGRKDDVIYTRDGRAIGRLSPVLKGFAVTEAQYVQHEKGELSVKLIPAVNFSGDKELQQIEHELRKRVGADMKLNFKLVDSIDRGSGGKSRAVISYVNP